MAMFSHRIRRVLLTATSSFNRSISLSPSPLASPINLPSPSTVLQRSILNHSTELTRAPVRLFSTRQYKLYKEGDEITEDTILFEGCDYNHWLITMDFPKDNPPSPEEMVSTYEHTCAQGLGISLEEAKKKIYACSTTTYQGFQAIMTEQESEKFRDVPGVVFILPDSYIDPQNKEYGGDKYEDGVITHRPLPFQNNVSRPRDRFNGQGGGGRNGPPQNFQRNNTQYGQQPPPMQGGGGGGSYGGPPQQRYGPPGQGPQSPPPFQGGYNQGQGSPPPPYQGGYNPNQGPPVPPYQGSQGGYNQSGPRNYSPQGNGNYDPAPGGGNPGYGQRNPDWNNNDPAGQPGSDQFPQGRRY